MKRETHISGSYVTKFGELVIQKNSIDLDYLNSIFTREELHKYLQAMQKKKRGEQ